MGLFKTKKKHFSDTQTIRLIDDHQVPDLARSIMIKTVISDDPMTQVMRDKTQNAKFRKLDRAYRWAKEPKPDSRRYDPETGRDLGVNNYYYQTPDVSIRDNTEGYELAIAQLKTEKGQSVDVDYIHFRPINNIFVGWQHLTENLGYNYETNELEALREPYNYTVVVLTAAENPDAPPIREERTEVLYIKYYLDHMVGVYETGEPNPEDGINYNAPQSGTMEAWDVPSTYGYTPTRGSYNPLFLTNPFQTTSQEEVEEIRVGPDETEGVEIWVTWEDRLEDPEPVMIDEIRNGTLIPDINTNWALADFTVPGEDAIANRNLRMETFVYLAAPDWEPENDLTWRPYEAAYENEYYQCRYSYKENNLTKKGYWTYDPANGSNQALNNVFAPPDYINPGNYFPVVVMLAQGTARYNDPMNPDGTYKNWSYSSGGDTVFISDEEMRQRKIIFDDTVKLCDKIGIDFVEMGESIEDGGEIKDLVQGVILMGIPITSDNEIEIEYLYEYFDNFRKQLPTDAGYFDPESPLTGGRINSLLPQTTTLSGGSEKSFVMSITDADFELRISLDDISSRIQTGVLPKRAQKLTKPEDWPDGEDDPIWEAETDEDYERVGLPEFTNDFLQVDTAGVAYESGQAPAGVSTRIARVIRKAIDPNKDRDRGKTVVPSSQYIELVVIDPRFSYPLGREGVQAPFGDGNDKRLLIPIDMDIAKNLQMIQREQLYFRGLHFIFNSHVIQKTKWYEQGWFAKVLLVVAVVIFLYTGDFTAIQLALAAGQVAVAIYLIAIELATMLIIQAGLSLIFQYIVEIVGIEIAMALAVVAIAVGGYEIAANGAEGLSSAALYVQAANGLVKAIKEENVNVAKDLLEDVGEEKEMQEALSEEMRKVEEDLAPPIEMDLYTMLALSPLMVPNETPPEYYERLGGNTNPGVQVLNLCQNFVNESLTLPEVNQI